VRRRRRAIGTATTGTSVHGRPAAGTGLPAWARSMLASEEVIRSRLTERVVGNVPPRYRPAVRAELLPTMQTLIPPAIRRLVSGGRFSPYERALISRSADRLAGQQVPLPVLVPAILQAAREVRHVIGHACQGLPLPTVLLISERAVSAVSEATVIVTASAARPRDGRRGARHGAVPPASPRHASHLTGRQQQVLELVAHGMSNRDVAAALGTSEHTVRNHLHRIYPLIDVSCRTQATRWWHRSVPAAAE
jgi:DNA-binding NarL/FixJ family response regulator